MEKNAIAGLFFRLNIDVGIILLWVLLMVFPRDGFPSSADSLHTGYRQGLNTENWLGGFHYRSQMVKQYHFEISDFFSFSRLHVGSEEDKWKDQHNLLVRLSRKLTERVALNVEGSSVLFSDKQSGFVNDIQTHAFGVGASYKNRYFQIPVILGIKEDRRFSQKDLGFHGKIQIQVPETSLSGYINRLDAAYEKDDFGKRQNTQLSVSYLVHRQFYKETGDSLMLGLNHQRRDYYISAAGEIESREEEVQNATNILTYRIGPGFFCRFKGGIAYRTLKISLLNGEQMGLKRKRKDFHTIGEVSFNWQRFKMQGAIRFGYVNQDQKYQLGEGESSSPYSGSYLLATPDNRSQYSTLSLQNNWQMTWRDSLRLTARLERFRYDTPDEGNFDDRDELRFRINLGEIHRFSHDLILHVDLGVNLLHFVYIYGEKSADNNWTRIFRLQPSVIWEPTPHWRWKQSVEVLANYVDYDFESFFTQVRSFLYRKYRLEEMLRFAFNSRLSLNGIYRFELDENGKLIWDRWLEQKIIDRRSHHASLFLNYSPWKSVSIGSGYTYYRRTGYRYSTDIHGEEQRSLSLDFVSHGPTLKIGYYTDSLHFHVLGNSLSTKTLSVQAQWITRIDLNMSLFL